MGNFEMSSILMQREVSEMENVSFIFVFTHAPIPLLDTRILRNIHAYTHRHIQKYTTCHMYAHSWTMRVNSIKKRSEKLIFTNEYLPNMLYK